MIRALSLLLVVLAAGCTSEQVDPGEAKKDRQGWVGSWDELIRSPSFQSGVGLDLPAMTHAVYLGEHLALHLLSLRPDDLLAPPLDPAHEALIVVEGKGTIDLGGKRPGVLEAGSLALLPRGTRGKIRSGKEGPLLGILLRRMKPTRAAADKAAKGGAAAPGKPQLLSAEQLLPPRLMTTAKPLDVVRLGSIPGGLTVNAVSVRGRVRRHVHLDHDEFVFVLTGSGDFGMGTESGSGSGAQSKRSWQPNKIRERAMMFIPFRSPHEFQNRSKRTIAISVFGPDTADPMKDRFFVADKAKPKAPEKKVTRQVPGVLPPPKKR